MRIRKNLSPQIIFAYNTHDDDNIHFTARNETGGVLNTGARGHEAILLSDILGDGRLSLSQRTRGRRRWLGRGKTSLVVSPMQVCQRRSGPAGVRFAFVLLLLLLLLLQRSSIAFGAFASYRFTESEGRMSHGIVNYQLCSFRLYQRYYLFACRGCAPCRSQRRWSRPTEVRDAFMLLLLRSSIAIGAFASYRFTESECNTSHGIVNYQLCGFRLCQRCVVLWLCGIVCHVAC